MLALRKEGIPDELKRDNRWVAFNINHEGKKIPIDPKVEFDYTTLSPCCYPPTVLFAHQPFF